MENPIGTITNTDKNVVNINNFSETMIGIKDSLKEIASLLILIHDKYFKNIIGIQNNLFSLIKFIV